MTVVPDSEHGHFHYDVVVRHRSGRVHVRRYVTEEPLEIGDVVRLEGRYWLIESIEPDGDELAGSAIASPARYRLTLRHPDGRDEVGAFRRFRPDVPRPGHAFSTLEDGRPVSWEVVDQRPARDEQGELYLELVAERDFAEVEEVPDHELEPGEEPVWEGAERYIGALILEEIEDDLLEVCGVDPHRDPRETWLATVKERLRSDLEQLRADVEGDRDEIERWSFRGGSIFVSVGSADDEADADKGHGWTTRLVDVSALGAARFERVRKADVQ